MPEGVPRVDVVVTAIYAGDKLLAVYDGHLGGFTLPMTKLREWPLGFDGPHALWETGADAAMRNVAECLGVTSNRAPVLLADVADVRQGSRTGDPHSYVFQVYGFPVETQQVGPGVAAQWLSVAELLDPDRRPISPTARSLVERLGRIASERKSSFPPVAKPPRHSVASVAVIRRRRDDRTEWLLQWNGGWSRYFLVGGHARAGESPIDCLTREVEEELGLVHGADYQARPLAKSGEPVGVLTYTAWSTSRWQDTRYEMSPFEIELEDAAHARVDGDMANRWVTRRELLDERCANGWLISPTTRTILRMLGEV